MPISRNSWIQAVGDAPGSGPDNFNLSGGTTSFDPFSNDLNHNADSTAAALADAHQYSMPGTSSGGLRGAYAEGTVRAELNAPHSTALARSGFDLTFQVAGAPAWYDFGGAFGTDGPATASARLTNVNPAADPRPLFSAEVGVGSGGPGGADGSRTLSRQGLLPPGVYALRVSADAPGTLAGSSAYYTIDLTLHGAAGRLGARDGSADPTAGPAAAPMPAAVWPGLIMLLGLAVLVRTPRRNSIRWAWR